MARRKQTRIGFNISNKTIVILLVAVTFCFVTIAFSLKFLNTDKIDTTAQAVMSNNIQDKNEQNVDDKTNTQESGSFI